MTNVKAGDLAIVNSIVPRYNGRIVEVLYLAPAHGFNLPNGRYHVAPLAHPSWVIKFIGGPARADFANGSVEDVVYGCGEDKYLRPLPGEPEEMECRSETVGPVV